MPEIQKIQDRASKKRGLLPRLNTVMPELSKHLEYVFWTRFAKEPRKYRSRINSEKSKAQHAAILKHFYRIKSENWPYIEMLLLFHLIADYNTHLLLHLERSEELANSSTLFKYAENSDYLMLDSIRPSAEQFPKKMLIPWPELTDPSLMNFLAAFGAHFALVRDKVGMVDGNKEKPHRAFRHDFNHFTNIPDGSDFEFWLECVEFIDSQPNTLDRKILHAMFFQIWHEFYYTIEPKTLYRRVKNLSTQVLLIRDKYDFKLGSVSEERIEQSRKIFLAWLRNKRE